jgi:hypothetical protein
MGLDIMVYAVVAAVVIGGGVGGWLSYKIQSGKVERMKRQRNSAITLAKELRRRLERRGRADEIKAEGEKDEAKILEEDDYDSIGARLDNAFDERMREQDE